MNSTVTLKQVIVTDPKVDFGMALTTTHDGKVTGTCRSSHTLICGNCNAPAKVHPVVQTDANFVVECDRLPEDMPFYGDFSRDYYLDASGAYVLPEDFSGPGTRDYDSRDLEIEYVSADVELNALERWTDKDETVSTHAISWWTGNTSSPDTRVLGGSYSKQSQAKYLAFDVNIEPEVRKAYVEGNDGFTSRKLLDETLTRKFHERLLNVYLDKQTGDIRIGSVRIVKINDENIEARCVNSNCKGSMGINTATATVEEMQAWTYEVISHGNNHAAAWFTKRETFYKAHAQDCDLNCNPKDARCNHNVSRVNAELNEVEFLMDHQQYCSDSNCTCSALLAEMVPALAC